MNQTLLNARDDFPILKQSVNGHPLVYFDNAASMQKPQAVIDTLNHYYQHDNSNVHRGLHTLSERATDGYEAARDTVARFLKAKKSSEIIFVRGTTEAINLVSQSYAKPLLKAGDEIIITHLEHHANIVPWQVVCEQTGATLRITNIHDSGDVDLDHYRSLLNKRTKMVALSHVSNAIGTISPVKKMTVWAHEVGAKVLIDGAQAVQHMKVDMQDLDCDFYAFSGHKCYGPTGMGILYGKHDLLEAMPPYQTGGEMIKMVTFEKTEYAEVPHKFEAGTPHIAGAVGLKAAINYIENLGLDNIAAHEKTLLSYATKQLKKVKGLRVIGEAKEKASVVSFVLESAHPHDIGTIIDSEGVAVRAGHHCAMPLMLRYNVPATVRASFAFYNTEKEIDVLCEALNKVNRLFS